MSPRRAFAVLALLGAGLACALSPARARAEQISFAGMAEYADPVSRGIGASGDVYHGDLAYGGGLLLEVSLARWVGFETGAIYAQRRFADHEGRTLRYAMAQLSAILRIWMGYHFSVGFGAYAAPAVGKLRDQTGQDLDFKKAGFDPFDFGGIGSVRWDFGGAAFSGFFVEGRYGFGWADVSARGPGTELRHRDIQVLAGIRFGG